MVHPRALLLAAALALADSASALRGSGSGSTDVLPACSETANATSLFSNAFSRQCYTATGFSLSNISAPLSSEHASSVCESYSCRGVYATVVQLALSSDCLLNNSIQLRTVLEELAPYCNGSGYTNDAGSGSYTVDHNDRVPSVPNPTTSRVYTTTGPSGMSGPTIATIVSGAVGALLAFVAIVVAVAWYKRQSLRDLRRRAYTDPLVESKTTPSTSRRFWSRPSSSTSGKFGGAYTATTDASSEAGINVVPLHPLQSSTFHGDTLWSDQELLARHMRAEDIEDIRVIGSGGHGVVYLVRHRGRRLLASKRLVQDHVTRDKTRLLIAEIKLVAQLDHPCIVQFVGAAWTTESDLQALFEYMPNGDLCTYLAKTSQPDESETWDLRKIQIAMDVAEALVYVHSFAPPLVHRDLKSRNILLDDNMRAKLTDFGVSRFHSDDNTMTTGVGTSRWLAPEVMAGGGMYNQTCDIYAFGMVLSELDTHRLPFSELRMPSGNPMPEMTILQRVSQGQLQPSFRATCPESLKAIALRCVAFEPAQRPSAIEVSYALRTIAKKDFGLQR